MTMAQKRAIDAAAEEYRQADARVDGLLAALEQAATDKGRARIERLLPEAEAAARGAQARLIALWNVKTVEVAA